jgi:hypothetical protein
VQEYVERTFFDSPTVASLNEQITRLIESRASASTVAYEEFIDRVRAAMHDVKRYGSQSGRPDAPHLANLAESIIPDIFFNICEAYRRGWTDKESGKKGQQVN